MAGLADMSEDERLRRRRGRNIAILVALAALSILFYAMAMVKFAANTPHLGH